MKFIKNLFNTVFSAFSSSKIDPVNDESNVEALFEQAVKFCKKEEYKKAFKWFQKAAEQG